MPALILKPCQDLLQGYSWELVRNEYGAILGKYLSDEDINAYMETGKAASILTGRISYFLGLQGPTISIDTACSSSLVALHQACLSLHAGECDLALSGGINLLLNPGVFISFCKAHMLAADGHCKTFDAKADGYARGEGCGIVVLKRLSDALKDNDHILAIIRSSYVNQDGASASITAPNKVAQEDLIRSALKQANLDPNEIDYIEAHGTGTELGDPIEINAITSVFSPRREKPLIVGSVKTNIGHLECAAGISGLIKVVLALQHEAIPPHLNFETLNPYINLEAIPAKIALALTPWPRGKARLAGISSFGFSGTNAHAIIEEAPLIVKKENSQERLLHLLTLSAKTEPALKELIERYVHHPFTDELADIAYTANTGRAHFEHRIVLIASSTSEMLSKLKEGDYLIAQAPARPVKFAFIMTDSKTEDVLRLWESWGVTPNFVISPGGALTVEKVRTQGCELFLEVGFLRLEEGPGKPCEIIS